MKGKIIAIIIAIAVIGVGGYFVINSINNDKMETPKNEENKDPNKENENIVSKGKVLVLYYSLTGNTETVANFIHDEVHGDIIKLETVKTYPSDYNELINEAQDEQRNNFRPELKTVIDNIDEYDIIFLGYPNWWADMPMSIYSFLDNYDLSGKTIAPFITHGGSGLSGTPSKIGQVEVGATITKGLAVSGASAKSSKDAVMSWLKEIGF